MIMALSYDKYYPTYKFMIYKIIRQYANHYNFSDMVQSAHLGYAKALNTYNKSKASLGTWIFINVRKECQSQKNQEYQTKSHSETRKHLPKEEILKIYDDTLIQEETPYDILLQADKQTEIALIVALMSKKVTKLERCIFIDYYLKNYSVTNLKKKYHISNLDNLFTKFKYLLKGIKEQMV